MKEGHLIHGIFKLGSAVSLQHTLPYSLTLFWDQLYALNAIKSCF